jgi:hypothetical protein
MNDNPTYDAQKLRDRMDKEDNILFNRIEIFLTANALLIASAEFSKFQGDANYLLIKSIAVLGTALTLLWFLCSFQTYRVIKELQKRYIAIIKDNKSNVDNLVFSNLFSTEWLRPIPIMAIFIPSILLLFWSFYQFLLYTCRI